MKQFLKWLFGRPEQFNNTKIIWLSSKEIEIVMESPNKPPVVRLNGKEVRDIVEVKFNYQTETGETFGQHNYIVKYCDVHTNSICTICVNKIFEGDVNSI